MKRSPGGTRLPYPEEMIYALAMVVAYHLDASGASLLPAAALILAHHCYLRPGELRNLTWRYIVPARRLGPPQAVITLHPAEMSRASKTGEYDETVVVDLVWLAELLLRERAQIHDLDAPFLALTTRDLQRHFDQAQEALGLVKPLKRQTLHVLRHSGATADTWHRRRTIDEVQKRGRWKSPASVRRYEKSGRVAERLNACSVATQSFGTKCVGMLARVLAKQCRPLRPA